MHGQPCCCPAAAEILGWPPERWRGLQVAGGRPRAARCLHGAWQTTPGSSHAAGNFRRARGWTGSNYQWGDAGDCRPSVSLPCVRPAAGQGQVAMCAPARAAVAFQSCKRSSCGVGAVPRVPVPQPFVARGERVCFRPCAAIATTDPLPGVQPAGPWCGPAGSSGSQPKSQLLSWPMVQSYVCACVCSLGATQWRRIRAGTQKGGGAFTTWQQAQGEPYASTSERSRGERSTSASSWTACVKSASTSRLVRPRCDSAASREAASRTWRAGRSVVSGTDCALDGMRPSAAAPA